MFRFSRVLIIFTILAAVLFPMVKPAVGQEEAERTAGAPMTEAGIRAIVPKLSGYPSLIMGKLYGVDKLGDVRAKYEDDMRQAGVDGIVTAYGDSYENEPSIAVNPKNEEFVVSFTHWTDPNTGVNRCAASISLDGGLTYPDIYFYLLPQRDDDGENDDFCSDPIVRFSPDGEYSYYMYMSVDPAGLDAGESDIVMCRGDMMGFPSCGGTPQVVFSDFAAFNDKPWLDVVHFPNDPSENELVFATTTWFYDDGSANGGCHIYYNVSTDYGATWVYGTAGHYLIGYSDCGGANPVVQGSRPIGGYDGMVAVCAYHSAYDGFLEGYYYIICRPAENYGLLSGDWGPYWMVAMNQKYEANYYLGPGLNYHRWWGTAMFPAIAMGIDNRLHVVSSPDPTDASDAEDGAVKYTRSALPLSPYNMTPAFTKAVIIANTKDKDGKPHAQGQAAIAARWVPGTTRTQLIISWEDHAKSKKNDNLIYDIRARISNNDGIKWGKPFVITDRVSMSDYVFLGDYMDISTSPRYIHFVWTDRSDVYSKYDYDDDVFSERY